MKKWLWLVLLLPWGNWAGAQQIAQCTTFGQLDSLLSVRAQDGSIDQQTLFSLYQKGIRTLNSIYEQQLKDSSRMAGVDPARVYRVLSAEYRDYRKKFLQTLVTLCGQDSSQALSQEDRIMCRTYRILLERIEFEEELLNRPRADFSFIDLAGTKQRLSDFRGRFVLLHFWNIRSRPCVRGIGLLKALRKKYAPQKLAIISLHCSVGRVDSSWEQASIRNFVQQAGLDWPQVTGSQVAAIARSYYVSNYPTLFLIDPRGYVIKWGFDLLEDKLPKVLSQFVK